MQGIKQGAGYQKVAQSKTQDIVVVLAKNVHMLYNTKSRPVAMGCKCVAKWKPCICKDYYGTRKIVNSYWHMYKKNL